MDKNDYLARIKYVGELSPSLRCLSALQEAHLCAVSFENLDIHRGARIVLNPGRLFQKIVTLKRGGFCYELNGLFHWLLQELRFQATLAMGRVYDRDKRGYGPEFDHMLNLVEVDERTWIVDVGFGDFSMHPLEFRLHQPLADISGQFLIEEEDLEYFKVSRFSQKEKRYLPEYIFSTKERRLSDFAGMCLYHQTSPDSHFTQKKVCTIATLTGRITLTDDRLIVTDNGRRTESPVRNEQEFIRTLATHFNIIL